MLNRMIDANSKTLDAARRQQHSLAALMLVMGFGCSFFAIWCYFEIPGSFLPYFIGLVAVVTLVTGIFRLSRREQYPQIDEKRA
jgi:hypothetical protein